MNHEELYLIHEDTYFKHIDEKIQLFSMVHALIHAIKDLPSNRGNANLTRMAEFFDRKSKKMFEEWNIPVSYLMFRDNSCLLDTMLEELLLPETAGYVLCDGACDDCCRNEDACPCCGDEHADSPAGNSKNDMDDKDEVEIGALFETFIEVMNAILGGTATLHVPEE